MNKKHFIGYTATTPITFGPGAGTVGTAAPTLPAKTASSATATPTPTVT
jgi:hypothetical protein